MSTNSPDSAWYAALTDHGRAGEPAAPARPMVLPGWSAPRLLRFSAMLRLLLIPFVVAITFESKIGSFKRDYIWIVSSVLFVGLAVVLALYLHSFYKAEREIAAGYTTRLRPAANDPEWFVLDAETFEVVWPPNDPAHPGVLALDGAYRTSYLEAHLAGSRAPLERRARRRAWSLGPTALGLVGAVAISALCYQFASALVHGHV